MATGPSFERGPFCRTVRRGTAHEIAINPKLIGFPNDILGTMLHEAAHAILFEAGHNGGIGSTPYYHTKKFRDQCIELGLVCDFLNTRYGWTVTHWPPSGIPKRYRAAIALLRQNLPAGTGDPPPAELKPRPLPTTGHSLLVCGCEGGQRTIYVKKSVLEDGGIICSFCGHEFRPRS